MGHGRVFEWAHVLNRRGILAIDPRLFSTLNCLIPDINLLISTYLLNLDRFNQFDFSNHSRGNSLPKVYIIMITGDGMMLLLLLWMCNSHMTMYK